MIQTRVEDRHRFAGAGVSVESLVTYLGLRRNMKIRIPKKWPDAAVRSVIHAKRYYENLFKEHRRPKQPEGRRPFYCNLNPSGTDLS